MPARSITKAQALLRGSSAGPDRAGAGTPCYVYSSRGILENYRAYDEALEGIPHRVCYAVKANSSLAVLGLLARAGAGFDIVSGGELFRVLKAGGDARTVVFSGSGRRQRRWSTRWRRASTGSTANRRRSWGWWTRWRRGAE